MSRISDERAVWLARHVLPHEASLRGWLGSRQWRGVDVDDVVQETYAILAGLESVADIRNVRNYIFSVANSVILGQLRRARIVSISTVENIERMAGADLTPSPEIEVGDRQELERLAIAIAGLPPRCREVFVLRKIRGLSQREVAVKLGVSEGTIEKQIHHGLKILINALGRGGQGSAKSSIARSDHGRVEAEQEQYGPAGDSRRNR
jgi:RNA polymerase sigma factor (sigma-70 family)